MNTEQHTKQSPLSTPVAIVMAGGFIAVAIYFGSGGTASTTEVAATADSGAAPVAAPVQPVEAGVGEVRPVTDKDHIRGAQNAKVTVIEYSDLECPFCKRFHPTMQQLVQEYPNDVQWVYRHFPLDQLHSKARKEAEATECAGEQGKFWEMTDKIFEITPANNGLNLDDLPSIAQQAGVPNAEQFKSCLESGKYAEHIEEDVKDAQAAGGRGTPYSVAIGPDGKKTPINGAQPYASVKTTVESLLK